MPCLSTNALSLAAHVFAARPGQEASSLAKIDCLAQSWKAQENSQTEEEGATLEAGLGGGGEAGPLRAEVTDNDKKCNKSGEASAAAGVSAAAGALPDEEEDEPLPTYQSPWSKQVRFLGRPHASTLLKDTGP